MTTDRAGCVSPKGLRGLWFLGQPHPAHTTLSRHVGAKK